LEINMKMLFVNYKFHMKNKIKTINEKWIKLDNPTLKKKKMKERI